MISFNTLCNDLVESLKKLGIKEEDLFNRYSDLHIGCKDFAVALELKVSGAWRSMSNTFIPNKGSDMDHYLVVLEIPFGAMDYYLRGKRLVKH